MAIYVPPSTRRRRVVALAAAGLVVGLLIGFLLGRSTSTGIDDAIDDVRAKAEGAASALGRLPIEYEQAIRGEGGESKETIVEALESARSQLDEAWADAEWFGPTARSDVDAALDKVDEVIAEDGSPGEFAAAVGQAGEAVEDAFGIRLDQAG